MHGNWVDLVILALFLYFILHSINQGFWSILADFLAFLISLVIAMQGYKFASAFLQNNFSLANSMANALGFLVIAITTEALLHIIFTFVLNKLPQKLNIKNKYIDAGLAVLPSLGEALVVISFLVILTTALPISPKIKSDVVGSKIGGVIVRNVSDLESQVNAVFGGVIDDSLTHLTIKPGSSEQVELDTEVTVLTVDEETERQMFELVNKERAENGLHPLVVEQKLVPVARDHARDMWERQYFSHYSPEGDDVGDRLEKNKVRYMVAGENLALAPTLTTAHTGLMNSEGHRKNILDRDFNRIGIGVIDNGIYGKMFVQIFTD